jgi:hypothetical protein
MNTRVAQRLRSVEDETMTDYGYKIGPGTRLGNGDVLTNGPATLKMQGDGNLVSTVKGKVAWSSGTSKKGHHAILQPDGVFVIFHTGDNTKPIWSTKTHSPGAYLELTQAGNVVLYDTSGKDIWDALHQLHVKQRSGVLGKLLPDPIKIVSHAGAAVGDVAKLKIGAAFKQAGQAVNQITGSQILQTAFAPVIVPANIINGAVTGGPKGALAAAKSVLKNPIMKATYSAAGMVFPPIAPATSAAVAAMESTSRVLDALESKDPKAIASAALQLASTGALAESGVTGAIRANDLISQVQKARGIASDLLSGNKTALAAAAKLKAQAAAGDPKAQAAHHLLSAVTIRQSVKTGQGKAAVHQAARVESPSLLSMVHAAMSSPHGVKIGDFSVLKTGRTLHKGKAIPHKPQHKSRKAYEAYFKAHHHHH